MFVTDVSNYVDKIFVAFSENGSFENASFSVVPLGNHTQPASVAFDHRSRLIYWADAHESAIYRSCLDGSRKETLVVEALISKYIEYTSVASFLVLGGGGGGKTPKCTDRKK